MDEDLPCQIHIIEICDTAGVKALCLCRYECWQWWFKIGPTAIYYLLIREQISSSIKDARTEENLIGILVAPLVQDTKSRPREIIQNRCPLTLPHNWVFVFSLLIRNKEKTSYLHKFYPNNASWELCQEHICKYNCMESFEKGFIMSSNSKSKSNIIWLIMKS